LKQLFVGVDEYDAPANSSLFSKDSDYKAPFDQVAELFKSRFFAIMKQAMGSLVKKSTGLRVFCLRSVTG
jgi:hypothetical protein